jgi:hypothetical protein
MDALDVTGPIRLRGLLEHLSDDRKEQARWLNVVYHVISNGRTQFNWRCVWLNNTAIGLLQGLPRDDQGVLWLIAFRF